ncbi:MAG: MarR family winged helix-turn-helix transcriptional regulator [Lachnospiraceae bacterium]
MPQQKEKDIGFLLKQINIQIRKELDNNLLEYDLTTSQCRILFFIHFRKDEKTALKDIEKHMQVTHPTVVGIVKRLEEKGFVSTTSDPEDRRVKLVKTTEKTAQVIKRLEQKRKKMDGRLLEGFTESEVKELRQMLDRIAGNLKRNKER